MAARGSRFAHSRATLPMACSRLGPDAKVATTLAARCGSLLAQLEKMLCIALSWPWPLGKVLAQANAASGSSRAQLQASAPQTIVRIPDTTTWQPASTAADPIYQNHRHTT